MLIYTISLFVSMNICISEQHIRNFNNTVCINAKLYSYWESETSSSHHLLKPVAS